MSHKRGCAPTFIVIILWLLAAMASLGLAFIILIILAAMWLFDA